jgi:DNA polymerase III subunit gamma/tau
VEEPVASRPPDRNVPLPGNKKMVKMPSLKDIQAQLNNPTISPNTTAATPEEEAAPTGPVMAVSPEAFQATWRELTMQKRTEGKMLEFIILDRPVTVDEKQEILLQLENPVQVDQFNEFRAEFLAALRQRLRNNRLNVRLEVKEQQGGRKLYTSQDKFNYLSEKHPILPELKKRLGLDTDF